MNFKKEFKKLAKKYNLNYQYQDFKNCFGGYWWVYTHSLYSRIISNKLNPDQNFIGW